MESYERFTDPELLQVFVTLLAQDRITTADLIDVMAEIDDRKLYLPAGYDSMHAFCVGAYRMSEDEADNRIRVARLIRQHPAILASLADGRLHLTAVLLLSRRLTPENAEELLAGAVHKTKREIQGWLERRFPSTAVLPWVEDLGGEPTESSVPERMKPVSVPERMAPVQPAGLAPPRARVSASGAVQFNLSPRGQKRLRHAQDLVAHQGFSHDLREIFERSLDAYIAQLEKRRYGATTRPRESRRASATFAFAAVPITSTRPSAPSAPSSCVASVKRRGSGRRNAGTARPRTTIPSPGESGTRIGTSSRGSTRWESGETRWRAGRRPPRPFPTPRWRSA